MTKYLDLGGNSGVSAYEIGSNLIRVQFSSGKIYTYSYASAGSHHIETMKTLAIKGRGLNSYITKNVRDNFIK